MIKISSRDIRAEQLTDINQVVAKLRFFPVKKKTLEYSFVPNGNVANLSPMTYAQVTVEQPVETYTADGLETKNIAKPGNYVLCGPSGELYVLKAEKIAKLYTGKIGGIITPEQADRQVAVYNLETPIKFTAPWGEDMVIKPGDYLVKEQDGSGYYRIAKKEFEQTYNSVQ